MSQYLIIYSYLTLTFPLFYCQDEQVTNKRLPKIVLPVARQGVLTRTSGHTKGTQMSESSQMISQRGLDDMRIDSELYLRKRFDIPKRPYARHYIGYQRQPVTHSISMAPHNMNQSMDWSALTRSFTRDMVFDISGYNHPKIHGQSVVSELPVNRRRNPEVVSPRKNTAHGRAGTDTSARAATMLNATPHQRIPTKQYARKGATEIARIAGRLLFASLFNDLTHGVALVQSEQQRTGQNPAIPSPDSDHLTALRERSDRGTQQGMRRPPPNTQQFNDRPASRVRKPHYSTNQREIAPRVVPPVRPPVVIPTTRQVARPQQIFQSLPAISPSLPQTVPMNWNQAQMSFIEPGFDQVPQQSFLTVPVQKKARLTANEKLALCCRKRQLSSSCQSMCNFDTFTQQSLVSLYITNSCSLPEISSAFDCASSMADHSECCARNGLAEFHDGQCMVFCRTHEGKPNNALQYMGCLPVFESIKSCYREYYDTHPNIYGDFRR